MFTNYDVAVVGAGSAGLQAALTLGRMRRPVVVFGTDRYRNDPAAAMHNFLGHDGAPPAELRTAARADLARYPTVEMRDQAVQRSRARRALSPPRCGRGRGHGPPSAARDRRRGHVAGHPRSRRALGRPRRPLSLLPRLRVLGHPDRRPRSRRQRAAARGHARPDRQPPRRPHRRRRPRRGRRRRTQADGSRRTDRAGGRCRPRPARDPRRAGRPDRPSSSAACSSTRAGLRQPRSRSGSSSTGHRWARSSSTRSATPADRGSTRPATSPRRRERPCPWRGPRRRGGRTARRSRL